ncbi:MAG TPA: DUF559 domain-containing protein [Chthonomonadaceae bacterium]|nr:DUF559 domain-containing protein [Chthonomonadaceae bacterium]
MTVHTLVCEYCGKTFTNKHIRQRFCSRTCGSAKSKKDKTRICEQCGKSFVRADTNPKQRFCSIRCVCEYNSSRAAGCNIYPEVPCEVCGTLFAVTYKGKRYCSRACSYKAKASLVEISCKECGKLFLPPSSRERLCSRECLHAWQRRIFTKPKVQQPCQTCGKTIHLLPNQIGIKKFCSRRCLAIANKEQARKRRLEQGGTLPERLVKTALEMLHIAHIPEHQIDTYTLDFFLPDYLIDLEVDGVYWHSLNPERDVKRDDYLTERGIKTVRVSDKEIIRSKDLPGLLRRYLFGY